MDSLAQSDTTVEQLYRDFHRPIQRYLERLVGSRETAEDLAHETFIKALRHWDERTTASVHGWIYRIAANTAYDFLRRRRRVEITVLTDEHHAMAIAPATELRIDEAQPIQAALRQIPEHYRQPLLLASAGYGRQDIAAAPGVNVNTIKTRVHQARALSADLYRAPALG